MNTHNFYLDFSNGASRIFSYKEYDYAIRNTPEGWILQRFFSHQDHSKSEDISDYFGDPCSLIKNVRLDNITIEDIFLYHEEDMQDYNLHYEYNYEKFLADVIKRGEYEFLFRKKPYFIDYWKKNPMDPAWVPGWIFSNDQGTTLIVVQSDFDEFIRQVSHWMEENIGLSLKEMIDHHYKPDNKGELKLVCINGLTFRGLAEP